MKERKNNNYRSRPAGESCPVTIGEDGALVFSNEAAELGIAVRSAIQDVQPQVRGFAPLVINRILRIVPKPHWQDAVTIGLQALDEAFDNHKRRKGLYTEEQFKRYLMTVVTGRIKNWTVRFLRIGAKEPDNDEARCCDSPCGWDIALTVAEEQRKERERIRRELDAEFAHQDTFLQSAAKRRPSVIERISELTGADIILYSLVDRLHRRVIWLLPSHEYGVFSMRYQRQPVKDIAHRFGRSEGWVSQVLQRAIDRALDYHIRILEGAAEYEIAELSAEIEIDLNLQTALRADRAELIDQVAQGILSRSPAITAMRAAERHKARMAETKADKSVGRRRRPVLLDLDDYDDYDDEQDDDTERRWSDAIERYQYAEAARVYCGGNSPITSITIY